jgi:hypothetical protein
MRVSDSSVGEEADQFHTTRWTVVTASPRDQNQAGRIALAALCDPLIATRGRLVRETRICRVCGGTR